MMSKLYKIRFELFFFSQLAVLFGSLVVPAEFFDAYLMPILFLVNVLCGVLLISKKKRYVLFFGILFAILLFIFGAKLIQKTDDNTWSYLRFGIYFLFYTLVSIEIIKQVWFTKSVSKNVIIGLMSGYVSLGFLAFFIFLSVELANPNSFQGLLISGNEFSNKIDSLLYFSYITILTIGYGDIQPVTAIAQKATVLVGMVGQFYIVIITTVVLEKFIFQNRKSEK